MQDIATMTPATTTTIQSTAGEVTISVSEPRHDRGGNRGLLCDRRVTVQVAGEIVLDAILPLRRHPTAGLWQPYDGHMWLATCPHLDPLRARDLLAPYTGIGGAIESALVHDMRRADRADQMAARA